MSSAGDTFSNRPTTAADYLAIFRRRKWISIGLPIVAAVTAYLFASTQSPVYQAKAEVYFNLSNIPAALANLSPLTVVGDPGTYLATQARVARSPELAERVVRRAGAAESAGEFLANSSATTQAGTTILVLSTSASNAASARNLVNAYADEFTDYKTEVDTNTIRSQLKRYQERINALAGTESPVLDTLIQKKLDLETLGELLAKNATAQPAEDAAKVRPRPIRSAVLSGALGIVLGLGLVFLTEALDRRTRSEEEIEAALGVPLLGRLPRPDRKLAKENQLVMVAEPESVQAETFRKLRTSLEFLNLDRPPRTIMVTSAGPGEGKSTTVANLAVAFARVGRQVALVDLDVRRPFLHSFFAWQGEYGITDVVVNRLSLDEALRPIAVTAGDAATTARTNGRSLTSSERTNGVSNVEGLLHLLPCGTIPPAADEFLERDGLAAVLNQLSTRFDIVLVDAPPLLAVGDAMALTANVDAVLVITRLGIDRRQLRDLARQLQRSRADVLGFVLTGVAHGDAYGYGYGYGYDDRRAYEAARRRERV